jgi:hypothetical protein
LKDPISKKKKKKITKKGWWSGSSERLPSKHEALNSNSCITKKLKIKSHHERSCGNGNVPSPNVSMFNILVMT